jgi:adenylosuccinate synthase
MDYSRLTTTLAPYQTLAVVGGAWGDEGKGKIADLLASKYDLVVRYSGGGNAGHTIYVPEGKVVSHLIPCGLAQRKTCVIAAGVFFDPEGFLQEVEEAQAVLGQDLPEIWIDERATVLTPWHKVIEAWSESCRGKKAIGTTMRGIGPMASVKALRVDVKIGDLYLDRTELVEILTCLYETYEPILTQAKLKGLTSEIPTPDEVADSLVQLGCKIRGYVRDTRYEMHRAWKQGKTILFEGAQAHGLDLTWGTTPYVSSGHSTAGGIGMGTGLPPHALNAVIMVTKILPTRVGEGPFPSEIWTREGSMRFPKQRMELFRESVERTHYLAYMRNLLNRESATPQDVSNYFQVLGRELGATSGRGRSVGYPDIALLQYAAQVNGPNFLALTRFDMLSGLKEIPVVVGYRYRGEILPPGRMPDGRRLGEVKPVFETWPCWEEDIEGIEWESDLPQKARDFLNRFEDQVGMSILIVGTGPNRGDAVVRNV